MMKSCQRFLFCLLPALLGSCVNAHPYVLIFDPQPIPNLQGSSPSLTPEVARLIFARRLGLSQYYDAKHLDTATVEHINRFGGPLPRVFDAKAQPGFQSALLLVEGVQHVEDLVASDELHDFTPFTLTSSPSPTSNVELLQDFASQAHLSSERGTFESHISPMTNYFRDLSSVKEISTPGNTGLTLLSLNLQATTNEARDEVKPKQLTMVETMKQKIASCIAHAKQHDIFLTIALMPPASEDYIRSSDNAYGERKAPIIARRDMVSDSETPLSALPISAPSSDFNASAFADKTPGEDSGSGSKLPKYPPVCYSTKDSCMSLTRNCTGHGECFLKSGTEKEGGPPPCFACACNKPEIRKNPDGSTQKTNYGGAACQKQDVSVPFWLIASFTVFLIFVISWGIGLLYSIGEEELPSVLGAGVAGSKGK